MSAEERAAWQRTQDAYEQGQLEWIWNQPDQDYDDSTPTSR